MAEDWKELTEDEAKDLLEEIKKKAMYMKASRISEEGEVWELLCPKCGCDKIVAESADLGTEAKCWECGYEFTITENCYKFDHNIDGWENYGEDPVRGLGYED